MSEAIPVTRVSLKTNKGEIIIELDAEKAPKTVENFLKYVNDNFYSGLIFHRVIKGFMVQAGGMDEKMNRKEGGFPIQNEADNGLKNTIGTVAMARTNDPHSATSQFFINVKDNHFLNHSGKTPQGWGYCVFGRVVEGMDVVHAIEVLATGRSGFHGDVPLVPVIIETATVIAA